MKVLFDYQAFYLLKFGGVSNGIVQIISNFPKNVEFEIAVKESDNVHLRESELVDIEPIKNPMDSFITKYSIKGKAKLYNMCSSLFPNMTSLGRNRKYSIDKLKEGNFDIFHPTFYDDYFLPFLNGKPYVLTIHDMIPERIGYMSPQIEMKKKLVNQAAHIATNSDSTKSDIMDILGVPESKITVIYRGAPSEFIPSSPLIEAKYVLFVGQRKGYKLFMPMIISLLPVMERHKDIYIVCTGSEFTKDEIAFFTKNGIIDRLIHIAPDNKGMMNLYANALCFIYPSSYEGFGIPILEAFKANCPTLLNKTSCFPEIAQDAAIYFKLTNNSSNLEEVMEHFLSMKKSEIDCLKKKQQKRLEFFSWEKAAFQYKQLYESII